MNIQSVVSLKELVQKFDIVLPEILLDKRIELSNPDSLEENDFLLTYHADQNLLELRYMAYERRSRCDCFWSDMDVGGIIHGESHDLYEEIDSLNEQKHSYFLVATFEHSMVKHYPVCSKNDVTTCHWDTGISGIFVPSEIFIQECKNDSQMMLKRLQGYFEEYTDWCNGEIYTLCKNMYDLSTDQNLVLITDSDEVGGFIGYQTAKDHLSSYF